MKTFSLRFFIRNLKRYNGIAILNIAGLSLGLAGVLFILLWIKNELGYDRYFADSERIYRVEALMNFTGEPFVWVNTPAPAGEFIKKDFPEVELVVRLRSGYQDVIKVGEENFTAENLYYGDDSYFDMFSTAIIKGDPGSLLGDPNSVVISERMAHRLFGNTDPTGRIIMLNNEDMLEVTGVMENSRSNTHLKIDLLVSFSLLIRNGFETDNWGNFSVYNYIRLTANSDAEQFNDKIAGYMKSYKENSSGILFINPLTRIYLYRDPGFDSFVYPSPDRGPITRVILFGFIGILILLIACINFINLSTACSTERSKEIGVRKVNGASRNDMVFQLFAESLGQTAAAMIIAILVVLITLPLFRVITGLETSVSSLVLPSNIAIYLLLTLVTGFIAGFYPALVLSSFKPVKVIRSQPGDSLQGSGLRKILVVFQFILSIAFIFCILVMKSQVNFLQNEYPGFDSEGVMVIYPKTDPARTDLLAEQIAGITGVRTVAVGDNVPVRMGNWKTLERWDENTNSKTVKFYAMQVDDNYMDLLGFDIVEGRGFTRGSTGLELIINTAALKEMEMDDPIGKGLWLGEERYSIIGVVNDFNFHKLKDEVLPVYLFKNDTWWSKKIFVKLEKGTRDLVVGKINDLVELSAPGFPPRYIFLDEEIYNYYGEERRLGTLVNSATILTVLISCIGLFSLTAFTVRRRIKEIGIRKAHGASRITLLLMLEKEFATLLLIASALALPLGYIIMKRWLDSYAFHISLDPSYSIAAMFIILVVSTLTIIAHALRAASLNPSDALRSE